MKKIVAILLSLCMILALCACGGAKKEEPAAAPAAENETGALNGDIVVLYTNDTHCGVGEGVTFEGLSAVKKALEEQGVQVKGAEMTMEATTPATVTANDAKKVMRLVDKLEELEDLQNVYHTMDITEEIAAALDE